MPAAITVRPVRGYRDMGTFIKLPRSIYADDPVWVPHLLLERRLHCSGFNPFFRHAEWQGWLAFRNGRPAGRISAQIDELHRHRYDSATGHFGMFECENDSGVAAALFRAAEDWLLERGTEQVTGPFNFSINQDCGILVEGFDTPPVIMMPHSRSWYVDLIEEQGYAGVRDLLAYWINTDFEPPSIMKKLINRYSGNTRLRPLNRKRFSEEMELLRDIFNDAWSENWGFVPFTREEFAEIGTTLRLILPDDFIQIAEVDGEAAAFIVVLPNLNEVFKDINGRLLPFGWWQLISRLRGNRIRTCRVPLMGVRKHYQNTPMGVSLAYQVINAAQRPVVGRGIKGVEMSWILDDNRAMRGILETIGCSLYKRYRLYEKTI